MIYKAVTQILIHRPTPIMVKILIPIQQPTETMNRIIIHQPTQKIAMNRIIIHEPTQTATQQWQAQINQIAANKEHKTFSPKVKGRLVLRGCRMILVKEILWKDWWKEQLQTFPNCFGASENVKTAKCKAWWKRPESILSDFDSDYVSKRLTKNRNIGGTSSDDNCGRKRNQIHVSKWRCRKLN